MDIWVYSCQCVVIVVGSPFHHSGLDLEVLQKRKRKQQKSEQWKCQNRSQGAVLRAVTVLNLFVGAIFALTAKPKS